MIKLRFFFFYVALTITGFLGAQNPTYIFVHGLGGNKNQVWYYQDLKGLPDAVMCAFNLPHVNGDKTINKNKVSLAQNIEIEALRDVCQSIEGPKVLIGVSMGAATILTYMSVYNPSDVQALILESPFDDVATVVEQKIANLGLSYLPCMQSIGNGILKYLRYPHYDPTGITPLKALDDLNFAIPILFVHSQKDLLIPVSASRRLYQSLCAKGHEHAYLVELEHGEHAECIKGIDGKLFKCAVHAFYKKYGLPYQDSLLIEEVYRAYFLKNIVH
jgi:pimeloyl-ACP methyl ester carboxylesterase